MTQHQRPSLYRWSKPKRKNAKVAVTVAANVIVVSAADAVVAEIAMTEVIAATATLAAIAKIAETVPILRSEKVAMTVAKAPKRVKVIANSVTLGHRKPLL